MEDSNRLLNILTLKVLKQIDRTRKLCSCTEKENKRKPNPLLSYTTIYPKPPWSRQFLWEAHREPLFLRPCHNRCPNNQGHSGGWRFRRGARADTEAEWKSRLLWKLPPLSASTLCALLCWFACRPSCEKGKETKTNDLKSWSCLKRGEIRSWWKIYPKARTVTAQVSKEVDPAPARLSLLQALIW